MMGVLMEQARGRNRRLKTRRHCRLCVLTLLFSLIAWGSADLSLALQQHELLAERGGEANDVATEHAQPASPLVSMSHGSIGGQGAMLDSQVLHVAAQGGHEAATPHTAAPAHPADQEPPQPQSPPAGSHEVSPAPAHPQAKTQESAKPGVHETLPEHGGPAEALIEHGPVLPEISPVSGVTFVETMIKLMDHELHGRFLGWRPNDIILGRFTDDVNNYQLGVLEALRFTTLRLKDSLTRMGDADAYDPDLEQALNLLMNRATLFWFPSAETSYGEATDHLRNFLGKLQKGQRSFYYRVDSLRLLLASYKDLLGNVNRNLIRSPMSWFQTDDSFYYAKGVAHVYYEILRVVRVGYKSQLASTLNALDIMDEILHELHKAERIDPWLILDSDLGSFFANHRANLNAPLSEVAHLLGVMSSF
jgi:hypothetical protein